MPLKLFLATSAAAVATSVLAAPEADLVTQVPGFKDPVPYKLYSGYLTVPGPINGYDSLKIHCELLLLCLLHLFRVRMFLIYCHELS